LSVWLLARLSNRKCHSLTLVYSFESEVVYGLERQETFVGSNGTLAKTLHRELIS